MTKRLMCYACGDRITEDEEYTIRYLKDENGKRYEEPEHIKCPERRPKGAK